MQFDDLSNKVIGCALKAHRALGPGLLESTYEHCFCYELAAAGIKFERQKELPVRYQDAEIDCGYRIDIIIENKLIIELKCVDPMRPIHEAQLLTYMKLSDVRIGLLINFNTVMLRDGIKRMVL